MTTRANCLVCTRSFDCEDEDSGEVFTYTAGISYVDPSVDVAVQFPENFAPSDRYGNATRDSVPIPDESLRSEASPAPDVTGLLVCIRGFEFEDPDSGLPRFVRYGHDYVRADDWLARYYPEHFVAVEAVVPSDRIPNLTPMAVA